MLNWPCFRHSGSHKESKIKPSPEEIVHNFEVKWIFEQELSSEEKPKIKLRKHRVWNFYRTRNERHASVENRGRAVNLWLCGQPAVCRDLRFLDDVLSLAQPKNKGCDGQKNWGVWSEWTWLAYGMPNHLDNYVCHRRKNPCEEQQVEEVFRTCSSVPVGSFATSPWKLNALSILEYNVVQDE